MFKPLAERRLDFPAAVALDFVSAGFDFACGAAFDLLDSALLVFGRVSAALPEEPRADGRFWFVGIRD